MAESEKTTASVLAAYRSWKEEGESLKARAQGCLMDRFAELIREAQQVQHDLLEDFGQVVKFPANPKPGKKGRARSVARKVSTPTARPMEVTAPPAAAASVATVSPAKRLVATKPSVAVSTAVKSRGASAPLRASTKTAGEPLSVDAQRLQLTRKLQKAEARLQAARDSGDPVRVQNAEDRVYELKDDLRLLAEQFV